MAPIATDEIACGSRSLRRRWPDSPCKFLPWDFWQGSQTNDFAALPVKTIHYISVRAAVLDRADVTVQAYLEIVLLRLTDGRRQVNAVSPDDRTRVAKPRYRCLPEYVLGFDCVPTGRERVAFRDAARIGAAEGGPIRVGRFFGLRQVQSGTPKAAGSICPKPSIDDSLTFAPFRKHFNDTTNCEMRRVPDPIQKPQPSPSSAGCAPWDV